MKKELRQRALATRNALEKREEKSRQIAEHILESAAYQNTERIFTFVSMGSEVETEEIIRQAWQDGKAVAVPKTEKHREMHFYEIRSLAELSEGRFGVREPKGGVVCIPKEGDLLLVPGLLFDGKKNRLGYGGGYYDTYFAKHKEGKRIGACVCGAAFRGGIADGGNRCAVRCSHNGKRMGGMKMSSLIEMGQKAKDAAVVLATLSTPAKIRHCLPLRMPCLRQRQRFWRKIRQMWMRQWKQASRVHLSTD